MADFPRVPVVAALVRLRIVFPETAGNDGIMKNQYHTAVREKQGDANLRITGKPINSEELLGLMKLLLAG